MAKSSAMSSKLKTAKSLVEQDADFRDFITELFAMAAGMQSLRRAIARRIGLGGTELGILLSLSRLGADGSVNIKQVANHLHVAAAHITTEVNGLVAHGYIAKQVSAQDSRAVELLVTEKGLDILLSIGPNLQMINEALFDPLSTQTVQNQRRFFQRVLSGLPAALARLPRPRKE